MSLSKITTSARHELFINVRRPGFIFVTLLLPALGLIMLVVTAFFSGQASSFFERQFAGQETVTAVVDQSGLYSPIPAQFSKDFALYSDEGAAKRALLAGRASSIIVIPANYIQTGKVTSYLSSSNFMSTSSASDTQRLRGLLVYGLLSGKASPPLVERAAEPATVTTVTLDASGRPAAGGAFSFIAGFIAPYIFSILLFVSVLASSGYLLRGIGEEKETRVIEVVLSSVSPTELLAGKVIGLGALGLTQIGVWLLSGLLLSSGLGAAMAGAVLILNPGSFLLAALYFLLGYLLYGTTMAAAGSLGTSMRESQQLAGIFSFMAAIPWFLAALVFTNPNAPLIRLISFFPFTAPTMMMLRLPLTDVPAVDIIGSLIVLIISIPIILWVGARVFRMGLLMYGKRPAVREIIKSLRQA